MTDIKKNNKPTMSKIFKRFFGFWVFLLLFLGINQQYTYAQEAAVDWSTQTTSQQTLEDSLQKTKTVLDLVLKSIYMLSRPLLVIAWNAMDNSLVYWSVFHLDLPLRQFWNIMKNFANYALWFVLLYHILKSLFTRKWVWNLNDPNTPLWIIKKILIAGILIQASRFMISAIIDISTVATYSIWWMPLTILKNDNNNENSIWNQQILWVSSTINIWSSNQSDILDDITTYRTYWDDILYKIANCRLWSGENWKYIIWKEINFVSSWTQNIKLEKDMCVLRWSIYRFNEFPELDSATTNASYKQILDMAIDSNKTLTWFAECWFIIPIYWEYQYSWWWNCSKPPVPTNPLPIADFWYEWWETRLKSITWTTVATLIDKSKWFVWPLITIYSSALNFSQLNQSQSSASSITFGIVLESAIKTMIWLMLVLPIWALAIIMVARIWILWMIIAFIPIIIIDHVLLNKKISGQIKALDISNIIRIIFAPVLVVFGLSISLIFMSTLTSTLKQYQPDSETPTTIAGNQRVMEWLWFTKDNDNTPSEGECHTILSMRRICTNLQIWWWLDNISYFLINIFGIAIMWSLLFWTISMTWNIWEKVWAWTKKIWEDFAWNIPIVPVPRAGFIGAKHIGWTGWLIDRKAREIETKMNQANTDKIADFMWKWKDQDPGDKAKDNTQLWSPQINTKQIQDITNEVKNSTNINETRLKELVWEETTKQLDEKGISITQRIQQPENIKLIYQEFEKQWLITDKTSISNNFNKLWITLASLESLKTVIDYKEKFTKKEIPIETIITNLNDKLLEALITIPLNEEIETSDNKKYKINKNSNGKYEAVAVGSPTT